MWYMVLRILSKNIIFINDNAYLILMQAGDKEIFKVQRKSKVKYNPADLQ